MTLRTGPGLTAGVPASTASALLISSGKGNLAATIAGEVVSDKEEQLAIFTDMNVDKMYSNSKTMPK